MELLVPKKKICKGFGHISALRPFWYCDLEHFYKFAPPPFQAFQGGSTINFALIGQAVSKKMFETNGLLPVYSPGKEQTTPWGQNVYTNMNLLLQNGHSYLNA